MNKITEWDAGDILVFMEASDDQVNYGGVDDPREILELRHQYKLESVAVGGWKSYVTIDGIEGTFNSAHFDNLTKKDYGTRLQMHEVTEDVNEDYDSAPDTLRHIRRVSGMLTEAAKDLLDRGKHHDYSKLVPPEKEVFDKYTPKLKDCDPSHPMYDKYREQMGVALEHHYHVNRHHPEFHKNGMNDMNFLDMIELIVDWKASSERHGGKGDVLKSVDVLQERFGYSDEMAQMMRNTINYMRDRGMF